MHPDFVCQARITGHAISLVLRELGQLSRAPVTSLGARLCIELPMTGLAKIGLPLRQLKSVYRCPAHVDVSFGIKRSLQKRPRWNANPPGRYWPFAGRPLMRVRDPFRTLHPIISSYVAARICIDGLGFASATLIRRFWSRCVNGFLGLDPHEPGKVDHRRSPSPPGCGRPLIPRSPSSRPAPCPAGSGGWVGAAGNRAGLTM